MMISDVSAGDTVRMTAGDFEVSGKVWGVYHGSEHIIIDFVDGAQLSVPVHESALEKWAVEQKRVLPVKFGAVIRVLSVTGRYVEDVPSGGVLAVGTGNGDWWREDGNWLDSEDIDDWEERDND